MAPLAAAVLDVAVAITDFIAKLTEAHPAIGILLGLIATLAGVFMTLGPPILGVIDFIGTFIKVFTGAGTVIEALMSVASALAPVLKLLSCHCRNRCTNTINYCRSSSTYSHIRCFVNSSETLRNALTDAWNAIASSVGAAIQAVLGFLETCSVVLKKY